MPIECDSHGLKLERQASHQQQMNSLQAAIVRSGDTGNLFISLLGMAIQGDLNVKGSPLYQEICDFCSDQGAVRK